ncbi:HAMP domain-containing histidine kinase [Acidimicrobiia bacterium EGI L10123]|uniref:sensor histidine kinase n=1 Tax=Salinilacustrithrix flava TaxID=2957203 RepID=UPI003D7C2FBC|nr:HAMP domain-containing histidine kinase [Acidimicrobiia bacterium EGI L10123]
MSSDGTSPSTIGPVSVPGPLPSQRPAPRAAIEVEEPAEETSGLRMPRLGLRARVTLAFAIGALLLSSGMSLLVLGVARSNLVSNRESSATQQISVNARIVRSGVNPDADIPVLLGSLQTPDGSRPVLFQRSQQVKGQEGTGWSQRDPEYGRSALPEALRETVLSGTPAKMRFPHPTTGDKSLAIGIPIRDFDGAYFEIVNLQSLDDTLSSISFTLFGASIATVLAGAALGWYSSRRILRPLGEVGDAARKLAGGELDTRIRALVDPDLEPIITSFNGMAGTLEDRIEKDAQFASDVSHELRSPLMTLQASLEVLENNRDDLSERARSALDLLTADLDRFRELVEDLLEISRFDAGVMLLELEEVLLSEFVRQVVRANGSHVPVERSPDMVLDEDFDDVVTALDKRRIARVLTNLLTNADKYGDGAVAVRIDADPDWVWIYVDDRGEGVPEEDRDRIFERFNRAGAAHRRGASTGVGLGLALVAEHVALHGGRVWVEDAPEAGARFAVELPRVEIDHDILEGDLA